MLLQTWIELQVAELGLPKLKQILRRQRLKWSRKDLITWLHFGWEHHTSFVRLMRWYEKHQHHLPATTYAGARYTLLALGPLWEELFRRHQEQNGITFTHENYIDTSLMETKKEKSITQKDWDRGRVTTRPSTHQKSQQICGEKALVVMNHRQEIVLMAYLLSINASDFHVLREPYQWIRRKFIAGTMMADRGFTSKSLRQAWKDFVVAFPQYPIRLLSPYVKKSKTQLSTQEYEEYRRRWQIETLFQGLKDPMQLYRWVLQGFRNPKWYRMKMFMAGLRWNGEKTHSLTF